jgi:hypothetical protein
MKSDKKKGARDISGNEKVNPKQPASHAGQQFGKKPEWANGLRRLYDSVVEEPLPDSFKALLSRLDDKSK